MQTCMTCLRKRKQSIMPDKDAKAREKEAKLILDEIRAKHGVSTKSTGWDPTLRARNYQLNVLKTRSAQGQEPFTVCLPCVEYALEEVFAFINKKDADIYMALMLKCAERVKNEKDKEPEEGEEKVAAKPKVKNTPKPKAKTKTNGKAKSKTNGNGKSAPTEVPEGEVVTEEPPSL